ncbi:hypothetical protein [Streptomyces lydicus]
MSVRSADPLIHVEDEEEREVGLMTALKATAPSRARTAALAFRVTV